MSWAGVDKLRLTTKEYILTRPLNGWGIGSGSKVGEAPPDWCRIRDGEIMHGPSFHNNTDLVNVDINPKGLLINLNPSKFRHPYQLNTDLKDIGRIVHGIGNWLKDDHGILFNVDETRLSRVDLARDRQLSMPITMYAPALGNIRGKRMKGTEYAQGYMFTNTQRASVLYNKTLEAATRPKKKGRVIIPGSDVSRFECRHLDPRPVSKDFGYGTFGELRRDDPEHIADVYRGLLNNYVFHTGPKAVQYMLKLDIEQDRFTSYVEGKRGGVDRYIMDLGGIGWIDAIGGLEGIRSMMVGAGMAPRTIGYNMDKIRDHIRRASMVEASRNKDAVTVHSLIDELKHAYAA